MGNRTIHLVRHGQYTVETEEGEEPDGQLTALGRQQAEHVACYLADRPIKTIIHSSMIRARETAVLIAERFPQLMLQPSDRMRECIPSIPAGLEGYFDHIPPDQLQKGADQAKSAFNYFFQPLAEQTPNEELVLVAHGNIINSFVIRAMNAPLDQWVFLDPFHCGHSQIIILPTGKFKLVHFNNVGYLPAELQTL